MVVAHLVPDSSSDVFFSKLALVAACDFVEVAVLLTVEVLWSLSVVEILLGLLLLIDESILGVFRHQLPHHSSIVMHLLVRSGLRSHLVFPDAPLQPVLWRFVRHPGLNLPMLLVLHRCSLLGLVSLLGLLQLR